MSDEAAALTGFTRRRVTLAGETKDVYERGEGPPVIVMAEIPGITPRVLDFARRVVDHGMTAVLPQLFGTPGAPPTPLALARTIAHACISREFAMLARREASPVTEWLRALARSLHEASGGPVGAVGMCLTGNFALTLALDPWLMAPVLSQPSLPLRIPGGARALHASEHTQQTVARRVRDEGLSVLGLRFTHDPMCPRARFEALSDLLGDGFESIEIDSGPGNPHGHRRMAHSVLTEDLIDDEGQPTRRAMERVLEFLQQRLQG
ncbi:MAG: dienelactone hydrolase family protein [Nannocystaceae bacterium]